MSEKNLNNTPITRYDSLCDLNLLGFLWLEPGSEWSSIIREDCFTTSNHSVEEGEPNLTNRIVLLSVLAILALLSAATWIQIPEISQSMQEVGKNSVKQLILN